MSTLNISAERLSANISRARWRTSIPFSLVGGSRCGVCWFNVRAIFNEMKGRLMAGCGSGANFRIAAFGRKSACGLIKAPAWQARAAQVQGDDEQRS